MIAPQQRPSTRQISLDQPGRSDGHHDWALDEDRGDNSETGTTSEVSREKVEGDPRTARGRIADRASPAQYVAVSGDVSKLAGDG